MNPQKPEDIVNSSELESKEHRAGTLLDARTDGNC